VNWIKLKSGKGQCFVDADRIVYVSVPFAAKGYEESRQIGLGYDFTVYALNTPENYEALKAAKIEIGSPEEWGKPRDRKTPRLVGRRGGRAPAAPPTEDEINKICLRLQDEILEEHGITYTGAKLGTLIRAAVIADPTVKAETIAEQWKARKGAR
jgi:hypothetical protein